MLKKNYNHNIHNRAIASVPFLAQKIKLQDKFTINPWFLTGFVDGEGCFDVSITKNQELKVGWEVKQRFQINLHSRDTDLLKQIKVYLKEVGSIYHRRTREEIQMEVRSFKELKTIITHFDKFPLITDKSSNFELFKKVYQIVELKEHLTLEGVKKILSIKASMNLGLSRELKLAFPNVIAAEKPLVKEKSIMDPHWLAGFTSAEGCFLIVIFEAKTNIGEGVQLIFKLTQHVKDKQLMKSLIKYFDCGNTNYERNVINYKVTKFGDIIQKIIPFFKKYKIPGVKSQDFADWCKVAEMMRQKKHLTSEGLENIKQIKAGMNTGRNN